MSLVAGKVVLHRKRHGMEARGEKVVMATSRRRPRVGDAMTVTPFCSLPVSFFQITAEGRVGLRPRVFDRWL